MSLVSAGMTLVSQSPCSSMATLPLATIPAELPAPVWAGVDRNAGWNGLVFMKAVSALPALVKQGLLRSTVFIACSIVAWEHSRRAK